MSERFSWSEYDGMLPISDGEYVLASDYDALALRLAEAEALLREAKDALWKNAVRIHAFLERKQREEG